MIHRASATPRTSSRDVGFTYDDAGRLTKEEGGDGLGVSYENAWQYDAAGNRSVTTYKRATVEAPNTLASVTTIASVYTGNDWLKQQTSTVKTASATNATTTFYGYDRNGAQTNERVGAAGAVEVNEWQFDGTLASTQTQGQATGGSEFVYDAVGNRLKQKTKIGTTDAKEVRYLVDPNTSYAQVVQERDENNLLQARYVWEDGLAPLVMFRRTQAGAYAAFFYLCDGQDSVRQLSDASGRVTDSYFYDAFGNALQGGSGDTPNTFRYTGQQLDPSGDYYLRARYYNAGSGRFLSHDPLMGNSQDPISMHRYLYAANDGVNFVDPSGEFTMAGMGMATSIHNSLQSTKADVDVGVKHNIRDTLESGPEQAIENQLLTSVLVVGAGTLALGAARSATTIRKSPGSASGFGKFISKSKKWLRGSHGNVGLVPKEIADVLRGQNFKNFDAFKVEFWKAAAASPDYAKQFSASNQTRMSQGLAPIAHKSQHHGKHKSYILHHINPIQHNGQVYDMDNIAIVTPKYHQEVLPGSVHFG